MSRICEILIQPRLDLKCGSECTTASRRSSPAQLVFVRRVSVTFYSLRLLITECDAVRTPLRRAIVASIAPPPLPSPSHAEPLLVIWTALKRPPPAPDNRCEGIDRRRHGY